MQPHPYHRTLDHSSKWKTLLSCTAGRPIDPDVFPEKTVGRSSRKAPRDRTTTPLKPAVGVTRNAPQQLRQPLEKDLYRDARPTIEVPFSELARRFVSPNSPSKGSHGTCTTISSSTGRHTAERLALGLPTTKTTTPSLTITASPSFQEDVSFLSFQVDDEEEDSEKQQEQQQSLFFWRRRASECFDRYGMQHHQTATAFLELGMAHIGCQVSDLKLCGASGPTELDYVCLIS